MFFAAYKMPATADARLAAKVQAANERDADSAQDASEISMTCQELGVDAQLFDAAGFSKGWVYADGTYSLR